jgi:hypothetical protein
MEAAARSNFPPPPLSTTFVLSNGEKTFVRVPELFTETFRDLRTSIEKWPVGTHGLPHGISGKDIIQLDPHGVSIDAVQTIMSLDLVDPSSTSIIQKLQESCTRSYIFKYYKTVMSSVYKSVDGEVSADAMMDMRIRARRDPCPRTLKEAIAQSSKLGYIEDSMIAHMAESPMYCGYVSSFISNESKENGIWRVTMSHVNGDDCIKILELPSTKPIFSWAERDLPKPSHIRDTIEEWGRADSLDDMLDSPSNSECYLTYDSTQGVLYATYGYGYTASKPGNFLFSMTFGSKGQLSPQTLDANIDATYYAMVRLAFYMRGLDVVIDKKTGDIVCSGTLSDLDPDLRKYCWGVLVRNVCAKY